MVNPAQTQADPKNKIKKVAWTPLQLLMEGVVISVLSFAGCSTSRVSERGLPDILAYVQLPQPPGYELSDIGLIFSGKQAPQRKDFAERCDSDFTRLASFVQDKEEMVQGSAELVRKNPGYYHWCFYAKILYLETQLKTLDYLDLKQKAALDIFRFLTLVANSFVSEFKDSRYLRWAVMRYQRASELVFYRKVDLTAEGRGVLGQGRTISVTAQRDDFVSVLAKYQLTPEHTADIGFTGLSGPPVVRKTRQSKK
jgi:hypothetical protein